jgi:hypothetical protein
MAIFYAKGRYRCRIIDQALGKASTGTAQFVLRFTVLARVVGPDHIEDVTQYERTAYFYITEKTAERFGQDLESLGFAGNSFAQLDLDHERAHDFRGSEVDMWCGEDTNDKGEPRERWGVARTSAALDVQPLDRKAARELDNLFGKHLKGGKQSPAKAAAGRPIAVPVGPGEGITDDDVPF